ncbi:MAG: hypothetical protein HQK73_11520, partial [Desulfamplus sp.]|nr:hypothetical protein [Desulfamplus sp.]
MKIADYNIVLNFLKSVPPDSSYTYLMDKQREKSIEEPESQKKKVIICAFCSNTITDVNQIISVNGSHQHVFVNPHGIAFETGCFKRCDGCIVETVSYAEFSWFHGYNWQIAGCRRCRQHLGWLFLSDKTIFSNSAISSQSKSSQ